jgi:tRNA modification GTPase
VTGDTIAAVATGAQAAALGIVRISGPEAARVIAAVVPAARAADRPRRMCHGRAVDPRTGRHLDDVLCFFAPGPGTATGEDTAEIHGHGGPLVMRSLLGAALAAGARAADPGEFTCRAFCSGRIDLTQAEAVMGLIAARSDRAARTALRQLEGGLATRLDADYEALTRVAAALEAGLDFPDEDLPQATATVLADDLDAISASLRRLADSFASGARLASGAVVALAGPANAGKSSLLNRLAGSERAIVDSEPGTTRDVVEIEVVLNGVPVRVSDTAGLRSEPGRLEDKGISKAMAAVRAADLVIVVLDGSKGGGDPVEIERLLGDGGAKAKPTIAAINKCDLPEWRDDHLPGPLASSRRIRLSALTGEGCDDLARAIGAMLAAEEDPAEIVLTTARQHAAVSAALSSLLDAAGHLRGGSLPELAAADLRFARESLASLTGRAADADVLDAVFSSFCIGK